MRIQKVHADLIYDLVRIPKPASGSASASVSGHVAHSRDSAVAMNYIADILTATGFRERGRLAKAATDASDWLKLRKSQGWDAAHSGPAPGCLACGRLHGHTEDCGLSFGDEFAERMKGREA